MLNDVGSVLRAARAAARVSQGDLATLLGIPVWTLSKVEHGRRSFEAKWLDLLPEPIREQVAAHVRAKHLGRVWRTPRYEADEATA